LTTLGDNWRMVGMAILYSDFPQPRGKQCRNAQAVSNQAY
jgi:hypothetical protein